MNRINFISTQDIARSPTLASSGVRGKCSSYQQFGIVLKNFILNKFIHLLKLLFNLNFVMML